MSRSLYCVQVSTTQKSKHMTREQSNPIAGLRTLLMLTGGLIGSWIAYSALAIDHDLPIGPAIDAPRYEFYGTNSCFLSYYCDISAAGRPLILFHSVNAAASAYEMQPIFEQYRHERPVYALDLPGFGFSERTDREYSIELYAAAVLDFMQEIAVEHADVIALSLSSEFVARAAHEQPSRFHSLTLISPTGFTGRKNASHLQNVNGSHRSQFLHKFLSHKMWSQALYDLLVMRMSLQYFLQLNFEGEVNKNLLEYAYLTSHQAGARFAPLYFVSGQLFTPDICPRIYASLEVPTMILYDRDPNTSFEQLPDILQHNPKWRARRIMKTFGLPQFERMELVAECLGEFWCDVEHDSV